MKHLVAAICMFFYGAAVFSQSVCPQKKLTPIALPALNMPRAGHAMLFADGELLVVGGHTEGFVPTATAEYLKGGKWHLIPTTYTHDNGFALQTGEGSVLVGGGHSETLGVGQTWNVERYLAAEHRFEGFAALYRKRTLAQVAQLADGRVIIVGNHYHDDVMESFDEQHGFAKAGDVSVGRVMPHLFLCADNDLLVVGGKGPRHETIDASIVDRLSGAPLQVKLLKIWCPIHSDNFAASRSEFIGDGQTFASLMPALNSDGQLAVVLVRDTLFSLLPTESPLPQLGVAGDTICWLGTLVADRDRQLAYVTGCSRSSRTYVLCIDYGATHWQTDRVEPAPVMLFYTDRNEQMGSVVPVLDEAGNLLLAGGTNYTHDNFSPLADVWLLPVGKDGAAAATAYTGGRVMGVRGWMVAAGLMWLCGLLTTAYFYQRKRRKAMDESDLAQSLSQTDNTELFARVCQLMEVDKLYLNSSLGIVDLANRLNVNRSYLSACINQKARCSFAQFVNGYRIGYAKNLLRQQPDRKIAALCMEVGFNNETSFFRAFKTIAGCSPKEWVAKVAAAGE